ncbi:MAG: GH92 family glycosyl hydrolase [Muribaculum sp.]|nr:GH92 family glycosyl hydrolase [Muribaculum sp.]
MSAKIFIPLTALLLCACSQSEKPYDLADPMVGTGFHGHTYPGATTPFGGVQLSPDTRADNWDACSGYHYSDSTINGFSHTHLSGTGCADLGDVFFRPTTMDVPYSADALYVPATFSHENENAYPGYYNVMLDNEDIFVELTATPHVGLHRYTYPEGKPARLIVDMEHKLTSERLREASVTVTGPAEITGYRITDGWTPDQHVYFVARFSKPFASTDIIRDGKTAVLTFDNDGESIVATVALSGVSIENAEANLNEEVPNLDFNAALDLAMSKWADALEVITVEGGSTDQRRTFYSALYHTMTAPNLMSDVNGQYRRNDGTIAEVPNGSNYYSTMSLWDTYRSWNPLMTFINPQLVCDMVNSMLDMYDATGELPIWPLASGETGCMIGYHSVSVIADAYLKGYRCFDSEHALKAMTASTGTPRKGADLYVKYGYVPSDSKSESASSTLEYSYDDWCIARMAEAMGHDLIAAVYYSRANNYSNLFDGSTRFFRGRRADGNWERPFNTSAVSRDLTEATPWQYRFAAMHDVNGMVNLFGGTEKFTQALDSLFIAPEIQGHVSDITGLIGQYSHGNEPSHHIPYLYSYIGQPWKTQEWTRRLLDEMYAPTPEGLCGNEDCGQMSAWFVMSALGIYPVCPGSNELVLTTPLFDRAVIKLPNDTSLIVSANNPEKNRYIKSVELNGKTIESNFVTYDELIKGGELKFTLTDKPEKTRGTKPADRPYSMDRELTASMPFIKQNVALFNETVDFEICSATEDADIYYTLDGTEPTPTSLKYTSPVKLDRDATIKAIAYKEGYKPSRIFTVSATKADYLPAIKAAPKSNGIAYRYYEGNCERTSDIAKCRLIESGTLLRPAIDKARIEDHFAFVFDGLIMIPEDEVYTFRTTTDDGSTLWIDGRLIVDNDGGHSKASATGHVALKKGLHAIKVMYFEDYEGESFDLDWKTPDSATFTAIPDSLFFIKP